VKKIMNPDHQDWDDFVWCMNSPHLCCRTDKRNGDYLESCLHDTSFTRKLLETFPDVNVEASLEWFKYWGGYCDCEVLFNVCWFLKGNFKEVEARRRERASRYERWREERIGPRRSFFSWLKRKIAR
jgi:Protein of unknown function (DUF2695)